MPLAQRWSDWAPGSTCARFHSGGLVVVETHPIQYHAPVWATVQRDHGIPVTGVYGSDFSVVGYVDPEFEVRFAWDTDLLSGYHAVFLRRARAGARPALDGLRARGLSPVLRQVRPQAVLLVGYSPAFHRSALYRTLLQRIPVLFRGDTTDHLSSPGPRTLLRAAALRYLYRQCSILLPVGQRSWEHYRRLGVPEDRLVASPHCVGTEGFRSSEAERPGLRRQCRASLGITEAQQVVMFSGKLIPRKAPTLLVLALRALRQEGLDVVGLFVGDGPLRANLEQLAAQPPGVPCRFVGFQNQRALSPFFHAADALALPSEAGETWGLVVNEALLHGLPAVVSDAVGCAPDLVRGGETGEVFVTGSLSGLVAALRRVLERGTGSEVREASRRIVAKYSVPEAAAGVAEAFHRVAKPRSTSGPR